LEADPTVVGVIVGTDYHLDFRKMCEASMYITENGAELVGMNADRNDGKDRLRPSGGSLIKMIQSITKTDEESIQIIGKPNPFAFELIK